METTGTIQTLKAHVALKVNDVVRSTEFYRQMLGIEPSKVRTGYTKFDVQNPPLNLTLNQSPGVSHGALSHMGIQVASTKDVLAMREAWMRAGLETRDEMQTNCCFARQDKTWVADPDGNAWEVFVVLEDNLPESVACCADDVQPSATPDKEVAPATLASDANSCCGTSSGTVAISRS